MKRKIWQYLIIPFLTVIATVLFFTSGCKKDSGNSKDKVPVVNTIPSSGITGSGAISGGNVTSDGGAPVTARGVCWSTSEKPTTSNSKTSDGMGIGIFTSSITGLLPGTTYYVRAYAINSNGTFYGNQELTTTLGPPSVSTTAVTGVNSTTAVSGGNVTSDGGAAITVRGVCWGTNPMPDISGNKTNNGAVTGSFAVNLSGLYQGTTYYVRAYATSSIGTGYGIAQPFTTSYLPYDYSYFPIGVWMQPPLTTASQYKSNGINTFIGIWNPLDNPQWQAIKSAKLRLIVSQSTYALNIGSDTLLIGYHMEDEPDNAQWNATTQKYDPCLATSYIINEYNTVKQNDPGRKVFLGLGQGVAYNNYIGRGACRNNIDMYKASNNGYLAGCDIAAFDIYPINNTDGITNQNLEYVGIGIQNLINWSGGTKPCWCWIETTRIHDDGPRRPDPWEVKSEVWMGIIHGAKGFGYFCHSFVTGATDESALLHDAEMIGAVKLINAQIDALAAVINSPTTTGYASVTSSNTSVSVDLTTRNYKGVNYIFAISMKRNVTTATFTVASGTNVEVFGEGRSLTVSGGKFTDNFTPYGVHIYRITN